MSEKSEIYFYNVKISPERVSLRYSSRSREGEESENEIWFEFSERIWITNSSLAVALSTLCGRAFDYISFGMPVSNEVLREIYELTQATIDTTGDEIQPPINREGVLLNFSGGFDSLAAKALMPGNVNLVSIDFGGRFAREREFFDQFNTLRISTNILDTGLQTNSWSFMGIGSILASHFYGAKYITFGGIMEASPDNFRTIPAASKKYTFPPFRAVGYENAPFVLGLTEVGTLMVLLKSSPNLIADSLMSLASPGEEKLHRKSVLTKIVADEVGVDIQLPVIQPPNSPHFRFGESFAVDILSLYVMNKTSNADAMGMVRDIPDTVREFAQSQTMSFMERANPTLFENFPSSLFPLLQDKLGEYGIKWYTEQNWKEIQEVRKLLAPYHNLY